MDGLAYNAIVQKQIDQLYLNHLRFVHDYTKKNNKVQKLDRNQKQLQTMVDQRHRDHL